MGIIEMSLSKLDKLLQQQEKIKLQILKEKQKSTNQKRKDDTRRKVLIGTAILAEMKTDIELDERVQKLLADSLVHDRDRELFGLPLSESKEPSSKALESA